VITAEQYKKGERAKPVECHKAALSVGTELATNPALDNIWELCRDPEGLRFFSRVLLIEVL